MSTLASHITISNSNGGIGMGNNASNANNNDSMASSNNSSTATSVSNNNSFSSVSLNSNFQQSAASSNTVSAATTEANINALTTTTKTVTTTNSTNSTIIQQQQQQDIFDVTIDSTSQAGDTTGVYDENLKAASSSPSNSNANSSNTSVQVVRRMRLMKRRYKSGLPLTNDRSENDPTGEEFNMRQYYDYAMNKTSKDDSGETFYHSRVLKVLMRRKSLFGVKIKRQQKMQTNWMVPQINWAYFEILL